MQPKTGKNIICKTCKKEFYVPLHNLNYAKYCSRKCSSSSNERNLKIKASHIGKTHSEKTKEKMSVSSMGKKKSPMHCERIKIAILGTKKSKDIIDKIRKSMLGKNKGEKSHWWRGGITPENIRIRASIEYRLWREAVFARDNWTCQKCGQKGKELHSHHIQNFSQYIELRFAIDNGVTLCKECHNDFHKIYGNKGNNMKQIIEFLNKNKKISNNCGIKGSFQIKTYKAGTNELIKVYPKISNLVVLNATGNGHGMNLLVKRLIGNTTSDLVITQAKIGTGNTAPTNADTDLQTAVLSGIIVADTTETSADVASIQFFMTDAELANGEYKEFGIFCGTQLFARALILPTYTKATGQDTSVEYAIQVNN